MHYLNERSVNYDEDGEDAMMAMQQQQQQQRKDQHRHQQQQQYEEAEASRSNDERYFSALHTAGSSSLTSETAHH